MAQSILTSDQSWLCKLSTETKPTTGVRDKTVLLEVDTATWYVFYDGTWYQQ